MTDGNRNPSASLNDALLGACSKAWRLHLSEMGAYLARKNVEGIRVEYSPRGKHGDFDLECFVNGDPERLEVPQSLVQRFTAVFIDIVHNRNPEWFDSEDASGVFEWYVKRNTLIHRHIDPSKSLEPVVRYGF